MAEQTHDTVAVHVDQLAATEQRLRELNAYGPVAVVTRAEGIPDGEGIRSHRPLPTDPDQRRQVRVGHTALDITEVDGAMQVSVHTPDGPRGLPLADIEHIRVDHPHGSRMPITGVTTFRPGVRDRDGQRILRWPRYALEYGMNAVYESGVHPDDPGIGWVNAYDTSHDPDRRCTLEQAKAAGRPVMKFLVSTGHVEGDDRPHDVITSLLNFNRSVSGSIAVIPPEQPHKLPERVVDLFDIANNSSDEDLFRAHRERAVAAGLASATGELPPVTTFAVDEAFWYANYD